MKQSYRQFLLQTLQLETLDIAAHLHEQKQQIDCLQQQIQQLVYRSMIPFATVLLLLWGISAYLLAPGFGVFAVGLLLLLAGFTALAWVPAMQQKLHRLVPGVAAHKQLITQSRLEIEQARQKAISYQQHLEPASAPGFLAVFADVLTHGAYPSCFSAEQRQRFVELSVRGQAAVIDLMDYGKLLFELKNVCLANYCDSRSLVEQVPARNKVEVALSYARLLGQKTQAANSAEVQFVALIGLNAISMCRQHSLPSEWQTLEHKRWELARQILQLAFEQKALALAKALIEFESLQSQRRLSLTG